MTTTGQETAEQAMARMVAADPDRQLCVRFMPAPVQPQAYALLALRHELLRAIAPGRSGAGWARRTSDAACWRRWTTSGTGPLPARAS